MNDNLINFLSGQSVVKVENATDMKQFVEWLNKYDIYDILVSNQAYRDEYAKISFWKKERQKYGWIHPTTPIWFSFIGGRLCWFGKGAQVIDEFGDMNCVVSASDL